MHYIRFLKTPKLDKGRITCLITITSDLGNSFFSNNVQLSAELWTNKSPQGLILLTRNPVQWTYGMRAVQVTIPFKPSKAPSPGQIRVRIGVEENSETDSFESLAQNEERAPILSAWSAPLDVSKGATEAARLIERRFISQASQCIGIWEETGESIARHIWDAGLAFCLHFPQIVSLVKGQDSSSGALYHCEDDNPRIIELGTGCGLVGIALAQAAPHANVIATDLSEAEEIARKNIAENQWHDQHNIEFQVLEWDNPLPDAIASQRFDLILAADCTYNPDSSPAFVNTISQLVTSSPNASVIVAMKVRHSSEDVFFTLMEISGLRQERKLSFPLSGDDATGTEMIDVFIFRLQTKEDRSGLYR